MNNDFISYFLHLLGKDISLCFFGFDKASYSLLLSVY